jgi:hypothetical protein
VPISDWLRQLFTRDDDRETELKLLEQWKASPFVQDTLFPLVGGPVSEVRVPGIPTSYGGMGLRVPGEYIIPGLNAHAVTPEFQFSKAGAIHEYGHVADFRNSIPELDEIAERYFPVHQASGAGDYSTYNKTEFKANLFNLALYNVREANSVASLHGPQKGMQDLMEMIHTTENEVKGSGAATFALLSHPVFAGTPLGNFYRQQLTSRPTYGPTAL